MASNDVSPVYYIDGVAVAPEFVLLAAQLTALDWRETAHIDQSCQSIGRLRE